MLQAYNTSSLLGAHKAIVVCFDHACFHLYWQMKNNMSAWASEASSEEKKKEIETECWEYACVCWCRKKWCTCTTVILGFVRAVWKHTLTLQDSVIYFAFFYLSKSVSNPFLCFFFLNYMSYCVKKQKHCIPSTVKLKYLSTF